MELRGAQEAGVPEEFELGADGVAGAVGGCGFDAHDGETFGERGEDVMEYLSVLFNEVNRSVCALW